MDILQAVHEDHFKTLDTQGLRDKMLVTQIMCPGELKLTYSHVDRIIIGGAVPTQGSLTLGDGKELGVAYFLERREMGVINIGAPGRIVVDGESVALGRHHGLYIPKESRDVRFESDDPADPARFYINSAPAHVRLALRHIRPEDASPMTLGDPATGNVRTINKYLHADVLETCQLSMGLTELDAGSMWNTMPCHTHERRMEVYFYFNLAEEDVVFHLCGKPEESRHIVVANEQAVIHPSWSIHCGFGTRRYTFIWGMCGENLTYDDMDFVATRDLR
ncbi:MULTISPECIES: 5-dehydro-4-deoxy-D-glucuronate isomerase [unclassified Vreelandella]